MQSIAIKELFVSNIPAKLLRVSLYTEGEAKVGILSTLSATIQSFRIIHQHATTSVCARARSEVALPP